MTAEMVPFYSCSKPPTARTLDLDQLAVNSNFLVNITRFAKEPIIVGPAEKEVRSATSLQFIIPRPTAQRIGEPERGTETVSETDKGVRNHCSPIPSSVAPVLVT